MDSNKLSARSKFFPLSLIAALAIFLQTGCSLFGIRSSEEAAYKLLQEQGQFQIRQYEPLVVATTQVDGDIDEAGKQAFRRLFDYISGGNRSQQEIAMTTPVLASVNTTIKGEKIAMTAPVTSEKQDRGWRFSFVLPAAFTLQNAPVPSDERVSLAQLSSRRVAVKQYPGSWSQAKFDDNAELLSQWLRQHQFQPSSPPRLARYDPPWTLPFLRRNEVLIDIES
jgi:DNA gyrase inhibitor GyrI